MFLNRLQCLKKANFASSSKPYELVDVLIFNLM